MLLVKGCSLGGQGDNILGLLSGNRLGMTLLETRSRRTLKAKLITLASAPDGVPGQGDILVACPAGNVLRLRFCEVWRAARFSRSLGLKQRLSWEDVLVFPKDGTVLGC